MPSPAPDPLARLVRGLDLEKIGRDTFRARTGRREGRLFGGLMIAQAVVAAGRTVADGRLHSLHAYFLRPGRPNVPMDLHAERVRDGRSLSTRRVVGRQAGDEAIVLLASFARGGEGVSHQEPMPPAPEPEELPEWEELRAAALGDSAARRDHIAVHVRACDPRSLSAAPGEPARWSVWIRPRGRLPDDPLLHAAFLAFASDRTLLRVAARRHGPVYAVRDAASLDHAMWFHHPPRADDWVLYACESPVAERGRALAFGAMYARDGTRIASVAQEGILRF